MRIRLCDVGALVLILPLALTGTLAAAQNPHVGHVATGFGRAPDGKGLTATASTEWGIAMLHTNFAAGDLSNLGAMQRHAGHVLHALDAAGRGPGLGFGLIAAADGVASHVELAADVAGASTSLRTHANTSPRSLARSHSAQKKRPWWPGSYRPHHPCGAPRRSSPG